MTRSTRLRSMMLCLAGVGALLLAISPLWAMAAPPPTQGVHIKPIGKPTWKPVDFHVFSAPVGTSAPESQYKEAFESAAALLPPPKHMVHPDLGIGPGVAHPPPYDSELAQGLDAVGYHEGVQFKSKEFNDGSGVFVVWMNIPAPGVIGSSPDFTSGPIVPNSLCPINVDVTAFHNNKLFDHFGGMVPALNQINPPFNVAGHSHFPNYVWDNADFLPSGSKVQGSYVYEITMIDQKGNGWSIEAHFTVGP